MNILKILNNYNCPNLVSFDDESLWKDYFYKYILRKFDFFYFERKFSIL